MNRENIQQLWVLCKGTIELLLLEWGIVAIIILVALFSFILGHISARESARPAVSVYAAPVLSRPQGIYPGGLIMTSKTGKTYYYPWCATAQRMALENILWFKDEAAAQQAGYVPAKNCKGLGASL